MTKHIEPPIALAPSHPSQCDVSGGVAGHRWGFVLGIAAGGAAALLVSAQWSIALVGAGAIFVLAVMENEPLLLLVIFLLPVGWVLSSNLPLRNVPVAVRLVAVAGFFVGRLWRGRLCVRQLLRSSITRASLLFLCAILVPAVLVRGAWTHESARSVYEAVSFVGFYFLIVAWANSRLRIRKVLWVLLFSTIVAAGFAMFQEIVGGYTSLWLYLNPPDDSFLPWGSRATSFLNYPNSLAGYLNLLLPFALACYALGKGRWRKLGAWTAGVGFVALLSTQSVGGLVAFLAVLFAAILWFVHGWRKRLLLAAAVCTFALGFYLARELFNPTHMESSVEYDASIRLLLWGTAWNLFVHSPIFGVGWGSFVTLYGSDLNISWIPPGLFEVHNIYLQLLAETGIIGFVTFFSLIFVAVREARRQFHSARSDLSRALAFGVFGAILTVLVHGLVDFLFQVSPQFGTLFWVLLALLVANAGVQAGERLGDTRLVIT